MNCKITLDISSNFPCFLGHIQAHVCVRERESEWVCAHAQRYFGFYLCAAPAVDPAIQTLIRWNLFSSYLFEVKNSLKLTGICIFVDILKNFKAFVYAKTILRALWWNILLIRMCIHVVLIGFFQQYLYGTQARHLSYNDFINKELILFSNSDNERSIPSLVDGLYFHYISLSFSMLPLCWYFPFTSVKDATPPTQKVILQWKCYEWNRTNRKHFQRMV